MLQWNEKIDAIIQAAMKRNQSKFGYRPQKYGTTSRDPVSMRGQRGGSRGGVGGRVGTGLAGSRRGTSSPADGRTGWPTMEEVRRRRRSNRPLFEEARKRAEAKKRNPQKRKPLDPMRQRMKEQFDKASAAKKAGRWGSAGYYVPGGRVGRPVQRPSAARRRSLLSGSRRRPQRRPSMSGGSNLRDRRGGGFIQPRGARGVNRGRSIPGRRRYYV
jgi:hypothetical protein